MLVLITVRKLVSVPITVREHCIQKVDSSVRSNYEKPNINLRTFTVVPDRLAVEPDRRPPTDRV